jgi:hypothetical protein
MEIKCSRCDSSFNLPDDRIPDAKKFKLNCPRCREAIIIDRSEVVNGSSMVPETFPHDATVAFLFLSNELLSQRIKNTLKKSGIYISEASGLAEAVEKVRINYYNMIIIEESSEFTALSEVFKKWNGQRRRDVNIIVVGANCQSMHSHEAFMRGVNSVIGKCDNDEIDKFIELALGEYRKYIEPWDLAAQKLRMSS